MSPKKILIIGVSGGLAQILCRLISKDFPHYEMIGIDSRPIDENHGIDQLKTIRMKFKRGNFENLFRENQFDTVYHLARMSHAQNSRQELSKRLELSVMGTNRILDLCERFEVKNFIMLSTFHVYGALFDNSIFLKENSPLKASIKYSQLRDVVEMDQICQSFMWKNKDKIKTVMLRPCNIIGNKINNTITKFLTGTFSISPLDYNPSFQFIHEFDMAQVLKRSINELPIGVYNVAPNDFITLRESLKISSEYIVPLPITGLSLANKLLKKISFDVPEYLIDYLKFSCLIDNKELKKHLGENFYRFDVKKSLKLIRK